MQDYLVRKPEFTVEIVRPNYDSLEYTATAVARFVAGQQVVHRDDDSTSLLSYGFSEALSSPSGGFSLSLTPDEDESRLTWLDKIHKMDLVFISEFGKQAFAGFVEAVRYSARLDASGAPQRSIEVSGSGIAAMLVKFVLVLNQFLYAGSTTAEAAAQKLMSSLAALQSSGTPVGNTIRMIYNAFYELAQAVGNLGSVQGVRAVINRFVDAQTRIDPDVEHKFPTIISLYRIGENSIWEILMALVAPPLNELFATWNPERGLLEIVFRETPFPTSKSGAAWTALPIMPLPALAVKDYDVGSSTAEIYTLYSVTIPGSGMDLNKSYVVDSPSVGKLYAVDADKMRMYGYKPMTVERRFFDHSQIGSASVGTLMRDSAEQLKEWFQHNDQMLSGTVALMTFPEGTFDDPKIRTPRIGERVQFLDAQFYVEAAQHSWQMLGHMMTKLSITRGFSYDASSGVPLGPVQQLGRKLSALATGFDRYWRS